jgi:hypothetical protein
MKKIVSKDAKSVKKSFFLLFFKNSFTKKYLSFFIFLSELTFQGNVSHYGDANYFTPIGFKKCLVHSNSRHNLRGPLQSLTLRSSAKLSPLVRSAPFQQNVKIYNHLKQKPNK